MGASFDSSLTAWISQGFERLVDRVRKSPATVHFDVLIVGSGYGGAMAAATFAGRRHEGSATPVTVAVLERGNEYLPGAFPTGLPELPRHVRRDRNKEGLFDIRLGPEVVTVVANGLGGGSLINAGVMTMPVPAVFANGWPDALSDLPAWQAYFTRARELLGASHGGVPNTILNHADGPPQKFQAFSGIAPPGTFRPAEITVAMSAAESSGGVRLNQCVRCGDCATGCNFGAKNSLDVNLLVRAHGNGAEIFSGATVLSVERDGGGNGWIVNTVHTNAKLRARDGDVCQIRANKVVLSAGMLGSSEILLRSRDLGLQLSDVALGTRCSTNGDMLIVDYDTDAAVHTIADDTEQPSARAIGPTITGIIDLRAAAGVVIEELSVPAGLRIAFTEIFGTVNALHSLDERDSSLHQPGFPNHDIYAVSDARIERSAVYAVMGDDGAAGVIDLDGLDAHDASRDGVARIRWNALQDLPVFDQQVDTLSGLTQGTGGRIIPNPVWKLLPANLTWLLENKRGPLVTVHPLGGCAMADSGAGGVVDDCGRVFSSSTSEDVHPGLVVLDGSIIPTALGINPALTISAVALRAAERLADEWQYTSGVAAAGGALHRPVFRETDVAAAAPTTEVEIIERLVGPVRFRPLGGQTETKIVELTLRFRPKALAQLAKPPSDGGNPVLQVATDQAELAVRSRLRIFPADDWNTIDATYDPPRLKEQKLDAIVDFSAPLSGSLRIFERRRSRALGRIWRASNAWLRNRGLRDTWQSIADGDGGPGLLARIQSGLALASRAGEIRAFEYDLTVGTPEPDAKLALDGHRIVATKRFTYERRCNPWRQLMEATLDAFPGLRSAETQRVLKLDPVYLARIGVPLFRITRQRDGANAIGELVSFFGYFLRLLIGLHIWSFRAPDRLPANGTPNLLPGTSLPGLPLAEVQDVYAGPAVEPEGGGAAATGKVRLTRYPRPDTTKRPVVMFHGYSASGTTFAHHAVQQNFAGYLWSTGRDVWIADLRTSAGQPATAKLHWSFDQIGIVDVPKALQEVSAATGGQQVDVVAHCMGAIVFSKAVLAGGIPPNLVNRAAFTQVGPLVVFSPGNIFRTYLLRYLIDFLPDDYDFSPDNPTLADDLWDRFLSTLPYPVEEFDIENPVTPWKRTPWTRIRHRMDALYGRAFNARNMEPEVLSFIDEHFGTLSLKTAAQTLHFVRSAMMTNFRGRNENVSRRLFRDHWKFPTFSLHGGDNGLVHHSTADRMRQIFEDAGRVYDTPFIDPETGHQDAVIGTKRMGTFQQIEQFLDKNFPDGPSNGSSELTAYPPWIGPIITEERPSTDLLVIRIGSMPTHRAPEGVLMLRIALAGGRIVRPDDPTLPWDEPYILSHMALYASSALSDEGWDALEAPLVSAMPGYQPGDKPGDGLLVLLVYDESPALPGLVSNYLYADASARAVLPFNPRGIREPDVSNQTRITFSRFEQMARAALRVLEAPPLGAKSGNVRGRIPGKVVRLEAAGQELALQTGPQLRIGDGVMQLLSFGANTDTAVAALEPLIEQDRDLMDGVIPYDPPANPPTSPSPDGTSFAFASCQYPAGLLDEPLAYRGYERIIERLGPGSGIRPRFLVLAGDQVYVDPTAGLYDPKARDDRYRLPYEAWLRHPSVRGALRRVPSFMLLDDHEIDDNWQPLSNPDAKDNDDLAKAGREAYRKYQRGMHPSLSSFRFDGFPFLMLDTRTGRTHRKVGALQNAALFDAPTMSSLKNWLQSSTGPKFVVSPAMLLPRHRRAVQLDPRLDAENLSALHSDGWDGYPNTLREVLAFIAKHQIRHVVFLSGDEHRACVATAHLRKKAGGPITRVHSIHTSAMYAPYPFANSLVEDLYADEPPIEFTHGADQYECTIDAAPLDVGDGATFMRVRAVSGTWWLDYEYADGVVRTLEI